MGREVQQQTTQEKVSFTVEQLVAVNPYNPDILPDLENYVNEQVSSQTYSLDANLCLLRLYQFEPERMSTQIVARILVKALMAMPAPDFSLCLFLIPERVQMEEQFKTLIVLSHYLETGRFAQFWDEASKNHHLLEVVPGFEQAIQAFAVHVLSLTYQKVHRSVLAEAINLESISLDKFIEHHVANSGWVLEKNHGRGQLIVLPSNEFNHPELKKNTDDGIPLDHVARIFPILEPVNTLVLMSVSRMLGFTFTVHERKVYNLNQKTAPEFRKALAPLAQVIFAPSAGLIPPPVGLGN